MKKVLIIIAFCLITIAAKPVTEVIVVSEEELIKKQQEELSANKLSYNLLEAIKAGNLALAQELIEQGADVNFKTQKDGHSALYYAISNNNVEMVKLLLSAKANVSEAALHKRCSINGVRCSVYYIYAMPNLNTKEERANFKKIIKLLKNADTTEQSKTALSPLDEEIFLKTAENDTVEEIKNLIKGKTIKNKEDALSFAIESGNLKTAEFLIKNIRKDNKNPKSFEYTLLKSAKKGQTEIVKLLIASDVNVNALSPKAPYYTTSQESSIFKKSILNQVLAEQKNLQRDIENLEKEQANSDNFLELKQKEKNIAEIIELLKAAGAKDISYIGK